MRRIFLVAPVLLVAACGNASPDDTAVSATPSGATRAPDVATIAPTPDPSAGAGDVVPSPSPATPKGGTVDPRKVPWEKAEPTGDGRTIRVVWSSGVEPCATLDRVDVSETGKKVTITLYEGPLRASPDAVCIQIAITKVTEVRLDKPLGDREIVDGAR
jgi:hypothetical protein